MRSWDYVAHVPEDLKLVITRESEEPGGAAAAPVAKPTKSGLFGGAAKRSASPEAAGPRETAEAAPGKKGLNLGRFFSGKKAE